MAASHGIVRSSKHSFIAKDVLDISRPTYSLLACNGVIFSRGNKIMASHLNTVSPTKNSSVRHYSVSKKIVFDNIAHSKNRGGARFYPQGSRFRITSELINHGCKRNSKTANSSGCRDNVGCAREADCATGSGLM